MPKSEADLEFQAILERRRRQQAMEDWRRRIIFAGVVFLFIGVPLYFLMKIRAGQRGEFIPVIDSLRSTDSWTHKEMTEFLKGKGLKFTIVPAGGTSAYYCDVEHADQASFLYENGMSNIIAVDVFQTSNHAAMFASASPNRAYYGRFAFSGSGILMNQIKKAIGYN